MLLLLPFPAPLVAPLLVLVLSDDDVPLLLPVDALPVPSLPAELPTLAFDDVPVLLSAFACSVSVAFLLEFSASVFVGFLFVFSVFLLAFSVLVSSAGSPSPFR